MDHRTRFMNCLRGLPVDRLPFIEIGGMPWCYSHMQRWDLQGIPMGSEPRLKFGFDCADEPSAVIGYERVPVDWYCVPRFPEYDLSDEGGYKRRIDGRWGQICKNAVPDDSERPIQVRIFEKPLVKTEDDWLWYKEHLRPTPEGRYPEDWDKWVVHSQEASHPIVLHLSGFFSTLTTTIGLDEPTGMFMSFHDRPDFIHKIVSDLVEWVIGVSDKALSEAQIDMAILGEQIAGDEGPMIGPRQVQEFFLDGYRQIVEHLNSHGIDMIMFSADGNSAPFVDMLTDIGIKGFFGVPKEMDPAGMRTRHGDELAIIGGIDRWALVKSKVDIKREVDRIMQLARRGSFIPCLSAGVLPETSLDNYRYYADYLRKQIMEP